MDSLEERVRNASWETAEFLGQMADNSFELGNGDIDPEPFESSDGDNESSASNKEARHSQDRTGVASQIPWSASSAGVIVDSPPALN